MSTKTNVADQGTDGTKTKNKGDSQQSKQKGAPSVSKKESKHRKDHSGGGGADAEDNVEKKQQNSI
ncbi:hypothetical protein [uncultured Mucilaginibacter sp.]|uniref:hypothetical protein n=1 Tax=uncultured Mucilaginibacter sp. TaxID=797541 RepID=UPI00260F4481|nr:hypothetical protein [uncultured Mucilaginibacter sp.]